MPGGKGCPMPKNQFQRPLPVKHTKNVPRHGQPVPPPAKATAKPAKAPAASLPPLAALLEIPGRK